MRGFYIQIFFILSVIISLLVCVNTTTTAILLLEYLFFIYFDHFFLLNIPTIPSYNNILYHKFMRVIQQIPLFNIHSVKIP